jgi:hypothetical protein
MKNIFLLLIFSSLFILSCKEKSKENKSSTISVEQPKNFNDSGKISKLQNGCNFNNSANEDEIEIFLPNEKELDELKSITSFSGLPLNFKVYKAKINNAVATIINDERYILYDSRLLDFANSQTSSFWSSISILAHEIGHHLSGHTLNQMTDNHTAELEADKFSGFVLYKMGASLEQSTNAISTIGSDNDTESHPSKSRRVKAISNGWNEAYKLDYRSAVPPPLNDDPNNFYEYTLEMLEKEDYANYYNQYNTKYEFMYGVITDFEIKDRSVDNFDVEIIKTGKEWEKNYGSMDGSRINLNLEDYQGNANMCNACFRTLPSLIQPGRRIKFAFNEGRPDGGSSLHGIFFVSYIKAINESEIDFYMRNTNSTGINKIINDFLIAEENRNLEDILSYYSSHIERYWNINNPSKSELANQYRNAWKYSKNAQNLVRNITKVNNETYILETNFRFYDLKIHKYKTINSRVKFIFDNNNKIIETSGI